MQRLKWNAGRGSQCSQPIGNISLRCKSGRTTFIALIARKGVGKKNRRALKNGAEGRLTVLPRHPLGNRAKNFVHIRISELSVLAGVHV